MKPDQLGDLLGQFHRWLVGRSPKWGDILVRLAIICVVSQVIFLLFVLGLRFCVWVTFRELSKLRKGNRPGTTDLTTDT